MTQIFNKRSQIVKRRILRNNVPEPELLLWSRLRNKQLLGYRFRRQFSIGRYVVDFYCPELRLVIEVDGPYHNSKDIKQYDKERNFLIKDLGIKVLRFQNIDIIKRINYVVEIIKSSLPLTKGKGGHGR